MAKDTPPTPDNPPATKVKDDPQPAAAPGAPAENPPARELKPLPGAVPPVVTTTPGPPK